MLSRICQRVRYFYYDLLPQVETPSFTDLRLENFEMFFIRLLHLLAHHPDFAITEEAIQDIAKSVLGFLHSLRASTNAYYY